MIAGFAAEMAYRRFEPRLNPVAARYGGVMRPSPYTMFGQFDLTHAGPAADYSYSFNPLGGPGPEVRVFMLGGSTVYTGSPPLPQLVQAELAKRGAKSARVFNYGVISQKSSQELAQIVHHVLDLSPDVIVMYDGGNDIMDPYIADPRPGYPYNFMLWEQNPLLKPAEEYPTLALLAFGSALLRRGLDGYFSKKIADLPALRAHAGYDTEPWRRQIAWVYTGNLLKAQKICSAFGIEFLAFFQPLAAFQEVEYAGLKGRSHARAVRSLIRQNISDLKREHRVNFIDVSDALKDEPGAWEDIYADYIHLHPPTNQKMAEVIAGPIMEAVGRVEASRRFSAN